MKNANLLNKMNNTIWASKKDTTQYNYQICKK